MTTSVDLEKVRWALAERLEGMREKCPLISGRHLIGCLALDAASDDCAGYVPIPLTAKGEIDDAQLLWAIETADTQTARANVVSYVAKEWIVRLEHTQFAFSPTLAIAYLRAVGAEGF